MASVEEAGDKHVIVVEDRKVAATGVWEEEKRHVVEEAEGKSSPVMVISVDPERGPNVGTSDEMTGEDVYSNTRGSVKSAPLFETETAEEREEEGGERQETDVAEMNVAAVMTSSKRHARTEENTKLEPVMVTAVDPVDGPDVGESEANANTGVYVNGSDAAMTSCPLGATDRVVVPASKAGGASHSI